MKKKVTTWIKLHKKQTAAGIIIFILVAVIAGMVLFVPDDASNASVTIKGYRSLTLSKGKTTEITASERKEALSESLLEDGIYKEVTNRSIEKGDVVNIAFAGYLDGKHKCQDLSEPDYDLEIGSETFLPGFEDGVAGKNPGDKVKLKLKFSASYPNESYAGHDVTFEVKIHYIKEQYTEETLTDDAVKEMTSYKTAKAYIKAVDGALSDEKKADQQEALSEELWKQLVEKADFKKLDQTLLKKEYKKFDDTYEGYADQLGISVSEYRKQYLHYSRKDFKALRKETAVFETKKHMLVLLIADNERIREDSYQKTLNKVEKKLLKKAVK